MFQKFRGKNRPKVISIQKKTDVPGDSTQDAPEDSSHDSTDSMDASSIVRRTFTLGVAAAGLVGLYMGVSSCGNNLRFQKLRQVLISHKRRRKATIPILWPQHILNKK